MKKYLLILILITQSLPAFGWPPTFGSEFNFTNLKLDLAWETRVSNGGGQAPKEAEHDQAIALAKAIEEKCRPECKIVEKPYKKFGYTEYTILFNDGFQFNISVDPSVVEVQTYPSSYTDISKNESRLQTMLFDVAKSIGLQTESTRQQANSAHFNIGAKSAFDNDPESFLRFLVDYWSRPELALGVLGQDTANAPPLTHLTEKARTQLVELIEKFYRNPGNYDILTLAKEIESNVYFKTPTFSDGNYHYQSVGLKAVTRGGTFPAQDAPIEIRAMFQPNTAEEFSLQSELIHARIEYLKNLKSRVIYIPQKNAFISQSQKINSYYLYVTECGLADRWSEFKKIIPAELHKEPIYDFFLKPGEFTDNTLKELPDVLHELHLSPLVQKNLKALLLSSDPNNNPKLFSKLRSFLEDPKYRIPNQKFFEEILSDKRYEGTEISTWFSEVSAPTNTAGAGKAKKGLLGFLKSCDRYLSPIFRF